MNRLERDRRILSDKIARERRQAVTEYCRTIIDARSGRDRRASVQIPRDNAFVACWMTAFDNARNGALA